MTTDTAHLSDHSALPMFFQPIPDYFAGLTFFHRHCRKPIPHHISLMDLEENFPEQDTNGRVKGLDLLSVKEKIIFDDIKHPKRKKHWLGGRTALKHALLSLMGHNMPLENTGFTSLSILPDNNGRPTLTWPFHQPIPSVSISHSGRYGVAMAAHTTTCGIDIQLTTPRIFNVRERLLSSEEWALLQASLTMHEDQEKLTIIWAAKEAVKKGMLYDQPLIFTGITLQEIIIGNPLKLLFTCANPRHPSALVQVIGINDYQLAFTQGGTEHA
ncbi:MAG: 4'-phosphopantetheinyl transferase superfamily protein [Desulfobulbaceae bacterium]|nr:4'-phosphopantetheinyl transferase superfamily protein [Desulfobulbaceae bacterium]